MKISIRPAHLDDIKDMQKFMYLLMKEEYEQFDPTNKITWAKSKKCADYFKNRITNAKSLAIIAEHKGEKIGYLSAQINGAFEYRSVPKFGVLADMFVLEEHRNLTIGTKLIKEFKKWAKKKGAKRIRVQSFAKNEKALRFYRRHGFDDHDTILEGKI
ncbi:GNAT family N-acetyltransferase [Patescibacteria group bacterium]